MKWRKMIPVTLVVLAALALGGSAAAAPNPDDTVEKAYELRMAGKADEARAILEKKIADDPKDAAARFELARTNLHIGLGGGFGGMREMVEQFEESMKQPIDKAAALDPENKNYAILAADFAFLHAYMSMKGGGADLAPRVESMCAAYEKVLAIDPGNLRALLCLAEIYGVLPEHMGGDKAKAEDYAKEIEKKDAVFGAKARSILLPGDADRIAYWRTILEKHEGSADVLEELGKACLSEGKVEEGAKYIEKAIAADPKKKFLLLDLGRYHLLTVMMEQSEKETALPAAQKAVEQYLETDPINPLKAYSFELMAKIEYGKDNRSGIDAMRKKSRAIDPFCSNAMGLPSLDLFVPPGKDLVGHRYLFRPL